MEDVDLKKIITTWICYGIALSCSLFISMAIHRILGVPNNFISAFSTVVTTELLTLLYRILFESEEKSIDNILAMYSETNRDVFRYLLILLVMFALLKFDINMFNLILSVLIFIISLIFI